MNKLIIPIVAFTLLTLNSCEVTIGDSESKKEIKNGFAYEDVTCSLNGSFPISNDELYPGTTLYTTFNGISNATIKDGFQHVGIAIQLFDERGEVILEKEDLLGNIEQQDPKLSEFSAFYTVPDNIEEGTKARFVFTLFDKYGTISYDYERTYTIVDKSTPPTKGCKIESNFDSKLDYFVKLYNGHFQYAETPVSIEVENELVLYINNIKGFTPINDLITINFSIRLLDKSGNPVFSKEGSFSGTTAQFDQTPLNANQRFDETLPKDMVWELIYNDANSDKYVKITTDIKLKN